MNDVVGSTFFSDRATSTELLTEAIDTTFGIEEFLLTGEVRVASRADVDADFFLRRTCFERSAANASDCRVAEVIWVKIFFHGSLLGAAYENRESTLDHSPTEIFFGN